MTKNVLAGLAEQAAFPTDNIPARLTENEYVIPADVVIGLGNGDLKKGVAILDNLVATMRENLQKTIVGDE